jgi:hypothetical protein
MDALAGRYRENLTLNGNIHWIPRQFPINSEGWTIWCGDEKVHSPSRTILYDKIYKPKTLAFWTKRNYLQADPRLTHLSTSLIDWDATLTCMKALPASRRRWITKHGSENCGVGITLFKWKQQTEYACPCCGDPENSTHVLRCTGQQATETWTTNLDATLDCLESLDTPLMLKQAIIDRLTAWRQDSPMLDDPLWPPTLTSLIHSQDTIGWKNFMEGLPSNLWIPYMDAYYTSEDSKLSPTKWLTTVLTSVIHLAWSQWQYRNHYLHEDGTPREKLAISLLHHQITTEFLKGPCDLPVPDQYHFTFSLQAILSRSTTYKQSWYLNVMAARQCQDQRVAATGQDRLISIANSRVVYWTRHRRLP